MSDDKRILNLEQRVSELEKEVVLLKQHLIQNESVETKEVSYLLVEKENDVPKALTEQIPLSERVVTNEKSDTSTKGINVPLEAVIAKKTESKSGVNVPLNSVVTKKQAPKQENTDWEKLLGQIWLPRVFIFVLILGILWGFKAAVDSGFITEPIRAVLGFITAGVLFYVGEKQIKKEHKTLGQVLLGGSIVVFILATFATHVLYGLIGPSVAFILNVLWVILGVYTSHKHNSQSISIIAAIAGFLVPYLVENANGNEFLLVGYEVLFFIAFLQYSLLKKYRYLYFTSGILLHLSLFVACAFLIDNHLAAFGIIVQHLFLFIAFLRKELFIKEQKTTIFTSFVLTQLWVGASWNMQEYSTFLLLSFVTYAIISFLYLSKNKEKLHVTLPIATYALAMFFLSKVNEEQIGLALLIEGIIAVYIGLAAKTKAQTFVGTVLYVLGIVLIVCNDIYKVVSFETVAWLIMIGSLFVMKEIVKKFSFESKEPYPYFDVIMNWIFAITTAVVFLFLIQIANEPYVGLTILIQGVITLYVALTSQRKSRILIGNIVYISGAVVIFLNEIQNVFSFETFAWITMIASFVLLKTFLSNTRKNEEQYSRALNAIFASTAISLLVFITQVGGAATQDLSTNIQSLTISSLWAIYAISGVVYGVVKGNKKIRLLGIGLLFLTLLKLIFIDMTSVSILVRAILFIGLGFIGVALSRFFYSNKKED